MDPQLEGLADDFTVIAWDAPGCGSSSDAPARFRLADYAEAATQFIKGLGLRDAHIVGLSFGGGLALQIYRDHAQVTRSLALASAYAGWAGSLPPEEVEQRLDRAVRDADRSPHEWVPDYLPEMFSDAPPAQAVDHMRAMMLDTRREGMLPMVRAFAEADLRKVLTTVSVPVLLLYGEADARSPARVAEGLHGAIPNARLVVVTDVGHVANIENPQAFNTELRRFLLEAEAE